MSQVFVCPDVNYDATTGVCSQGVWVDQTSLAVVPPLSVDDGQSIAFGIVLCWVIGYLWRLIGDALDA